VRTARSSLGKFDTVCVLTATVMAGPLPPGWTEHTAPTGHKYYYNADLKKSTYKRPTLEAAAEPPKPPQQETPPVVAPQQPVIPNTALNVRKQDNVVPLSEWSADSAVARPQPQSVQQTAPHRMTEEMWKKLEDRPRKKYNPHIQLNDR
jgi:WW domain